MFIAIVGAKLAWAQVLVGLGEQRGAKKLNGQRWAGFCAAKSRPSCRLKVCIAITGEVQQR